MTAPVKLQVVRYQCPYCSYRKSSRTTVREHMDRCWYRPENRGCKTCEYFDFDAGGPASPARDVCGKTRPLPDGPTTGCPLWAPDEDHAP